MRVLELPSWYIPEGGWFVRDQAWALQEQGVEVHILANVLLPITKFRWRYFDFLRYPTRPYFTEELGITILRHWHRPIPKARIYNIKKWAEQTVQLFDLYISRYSKPDIIHVHSGTWGAYAAALIKAKHAVPYIVTEHRGMFGCRSKLARDFFRKDFEPFFIKGFSDADMLVPVSEQLIPKMQSYLEKEVPVKVVSNIVDTDFFVANSQVIKPHSPFRFVSCNGFYEVKGYDILLPAFDEVVAHHPDVSLRLVGENFEKSAFQRLLKNCKNKDKISFTGKLQADGVLRELQNADAFVMSSRVEAEPVSILEALSVGLPIAGTEVIPRYELPDSLGVKVPIEQPELLAQAMTYLIENYANYSPEKAHEHTVKIAHKTVIAKQLIEIYEEVLSRARTDRNC
ncbi:MAG: glycosyltransferase [Paludibacteraceae bacterium]|nr:glycosyltransferase [Paludibacteraceae bacterium]